MYCSARTLCVNKLALYCTVATVIAFHVEKGGSRLTELIESIRRLNGVPNLADLVRLALFRPVHPAGAKYEASASQPPRENRKYHRLNDSDYFPNFENIGPLLGLGNGH